MRRYWLFTQEMTKAECGQKGRGLTVQMSLHKTLHLPFYWERDAHRLRFWTLGQFQHYFRTTVWCRYLFMNTLPHKLYSTILSLFLRKPDDVHCQPKHVIYQNITSNKLTELCFLTTYPFSRWRVIFVSFVLGSFESYACSVVFFSKTHFYF